jgi:ketosteroid isomerase-like protein
MQTREIEAVRKADSQWAEAEATADVGALDRLLAADFAGVGLRGFVLTKEQWLDRYRSGDLRTGPIEQHEAALRLYGETAIVLARESQRNTYRGTAVDAEFRATRVFVKQEGAWRLASLQLSPVAQAPS